MVTVVIIQARMGSTRLPGKVLADLAGMPALWHIIERVRHSVLPDEIVVATTTNSEDEPLCNFCKKWGVRVFCGDPDDVLKRYHDAVENLEQNNISVDLIVRITADCPFIDPDIIDLAIQYAVCGGYDYVSNTNPPTFPDGLDVEVFSRFALEDAYINALMASEREHVTSYIRNNSRLNNYNFTNSENLSEMRWTLDTREDLEFIQNVYLSLYVPEKIFSTGQILDYLQSHPDLQKINAMNRRNEGYEKSLMKDNVITTTRSK